MKSLIRVVVRSAFSFALAVVGTDALAAGNVTVSVVNDELRITGDSSSNQIEIEQTVLNRYRVKGLNGTKVNGRNDDAFRVKKGIVANMNGGNDKIVVAGEFVGILADNVDGLLNLNMGSGSDTVDLKFLVVDNNISINMGQGEEETVSMFAVASNGGISVVSGNGDDTINLISVSAENAINVTTQGGRDDINLSFSDAAFVGIQSGLGNDDVTLNLVQSESDIEVETDDGDDLVELTNCVVEDLLGIATGDDDDQLSIDGCSGQELLVLLGDDDDQLSISQNEFQAATLDGEGDDNLLLDAGDNSFGILNDDNFDN